MDKDRIRYTIHYYSADGSHYEVHHRFYREYYDAMMLSIKLVNYRLWDKAVVHSNETGVQTPITEVHRDNAVYLVSQQRLVERYEAAQNARYKSDLTAARVKQKILEATDKSCVACTGELDLLPTEIY